MKKTPFILVLATWLPAQALGQAFFTLYNATAQTRLGSSDGPLAGPGIWAQALAGTSDGNLNPVGPSLEHNEFGVVRATVSVPGTFAGETAFVQMAAWDGTIWGNSFGSIPENQIGYTDTVHLTLVMGGGQPPAVTMFTTPAVVPPVPEPPVMTLTALGIVALAYGIRPSRARRAPREL